MGRRCSKVKLNFSFLENANSCDGETLLCAISHTTRIYNMVYKNDETCVRLFVF